MNKLILSILLQITSLLLFSQEMVNTTNIIKSDTVHQLELDFIDLEKVPIAPDCENFESNKERIECFGNFMQQHVIKNFNFDLLDTLDLTEGKYIIKTIFVISKLGKIENILVNAPHQELKNEAIRVLQLLPTLIPGQEKGGNNVSVRYSLPIIVMVESDKLIKKNKRKKLS
jgi:hypothetical protein